MYQRKIAIFIAALLLAQGVALSGSGTARAESFVEGPFEQQWQATDQAVATGQASRTYFWGPQPFAHTAEVYAESPNGGQRRVQYFDKARMELSKKGQQDPNFVTNGLLTSELISGQLQIGDNQFLGRDPANIQVAGDTVGNDNTPTYASFNQGKLAFGVAGHTAAPNRTGQPIAVAVDKFGAVSSLPQPPTALKYVRYFSQTGHNLAEVFGNFFQTAPLDESKWLAIMGYPITEPFWAKEIVIVGGQPRAVLIQLFQRRVLTYTPANPAAYQVEMGNIGQHYYVWRYNFAVGDQLPGNYRLIVPRNNLLYSNSIRQAESLKLGETSGSIYNFWPDNQGRAVIGAGYSAYLANLSVPGPFQKLDWPAGVSEADVLGVSWDARGERLAILVGVRSPNRTQIIKEIVQVFNLTRQGAVNNVTTYDTVPTGKYPVQLKMSPDGQYLAFADQNSDNSLRLNIRQLSNRTTRQLTLGHTGNLTNLDWQGKTNRLLIEMREVEATGGKILQIDAATGKLDNWLDDKTIEDFSLSPDGNYVALKQAKAIGTARTISLRATSDPKTELTPPYLSRQGYNIYLDGWSKDGTYLVVKTIGRAEMDMFYREVELVSVATGRPFQVYKFGGLLTFGGDTLLGGPHHLIKFANTNSEPSITVQNIDGSDPLGMFTGQTDGLRFGLARIVQV